MKTTDETNVSETAVQEEPIVIIHLDDEPLVDKGCRLVGHAQALADYAHPLIVTMTTDSLAAYNAALAIASCCWKQAASGGTPEIFERIAWKLCEEFYPDENPAAIHGQMLDRFHKMFPYFEQDREMLYLHEAPVDPPPQYEVFDDSHLKTSGESLPLKPSEVPTAELGEFVNHAQVTGKKFEEYEAELHVLQERLAGMFLEWLKEKGNEGDLADDATGIAYRFVEFVYMFNGSGYTNITAEMVTEFLDRWFIRKCAFEPGWMTMAPAALKAFFTFLAEKKLADGASEAVAAVDGARKKFLRNVAHYTNPAAAAVQAA